MSNAPDKIAFNANNHTFSMPRITEAGARFEYILNNPDAMLAAGYVPVDQILARNQPCGCIICYCADEEQCHGCGAKNCGAHPIGEFPAPAYVTASADQVVSVKPLVWIARDWRGVGQAIYDAMCPITNMVLFRIIECSDGWELSDEMQCLNTVHFNETMAKVAAQTFQNTRILSAITTQPATPDIDAPQNVYSGEMVDAAFAELDALRKKYAAACAAADGYKDDLHKALERNHQPAAPINADDIIEDALGHMFTEKKHERIKAEVRNAALQEAAEIGDEFQERIGDEIRALMTKETGG